MTDNQEWVSCDEIEVNDVIRWNEPLWAKPTKARGKRDKIGEQQIEAELIDINDTLNFKVINVQKLSGGDDAVVKVAPDDNIRRKKETIIMGDCHKRVG